MQRLSIIALAIAAPLVMSSPALAVLGCQAGYVNATCRDGTLNCCMPATSFDCGDGTHGNFEYCEAKRRPQTRYQPPNRKIETPTCMDSGRIYNPRTGKCDRY
jgi:hypothetical protein